MKQAARFVRQLAATGLLLLLALPLAARSPGSDLDLFGDGGQCIACHSNMQDERGEDISIGYTWRASMMANAGRDPYWLAAVRREIMDHPQAREVIEDKCATCHIPVARFVARARGEPGRIFEHYETEPRDPALTRLARDGVTCSVCHQITAEGFGDSESFTGGFHIDPHTPPGNRGIFGPHEIDAGRTRIMNSASKFVPTQSDHLASSEMCATCHTLYTHALDDNGNEAGQLPEQVPYLEWQHSGYRESRSCQDCHMPELPDPAPITSVLGEPRPRFSQHVFRGGNAFMLRLLNTHREELGVQAPPHELEAAAARTEAHLRSHAARLTIESFDHSGSAAQVTLRVENLAGHKLPTAYPSRRAWLHLVVTDGSGRIVFESGTLDPDGSIAGNDNDEDPLHYEPHYDVIESTEEVQIYESVMVDFAGRVTTGLLYGTRYIKDNRILPKGFDKTTAPEDVAVRGAARDDENFSAPGDRVQYRFDVGDAQGPLRARAELRYQSIGYRWATNLKDYASASEPARFVRYYEAAAAESAITLATATRTSGGPSP